MKFRGTNKIKMKIKVTFLILMFICVQKSVSQCDAVTVESVTNFTPFALDSIAESEGLRNGPNYNGANVFYPVNGNNSLKSIVLVPGYTAEQKSVMGWARYLASRGFVCMTIGTNSLTDFPSIRANALIDAMETIRQENNRQTSPLYQKIDTNNIAVGGWSMGGGGAQLAAKIDPRIKAVLAITPWLYENTLSASDLNHNVPVLIISGELDPTAPASRHANVHYNYTPSATHKLLFEISGADHNIPLNPLTGNGDVGNLGYAWLKLFLEGTNCYCNMLSDASLDQNETASKYFTNLSCASLSVANIKNTDLKIKIFPSLATDEIRIEFSKEQQLEYIVSNLFGQQIKEGKVRSGDTIRVEELSIGMHFLIVGQKVFKFLKT
jgi:dienelactone hydrolase